ncbi:putative mitochondrial carrier protein [Gonapodya prolifera JEL478]|uniref:Putative mitochondrial carrier protein n=1 Tax=Gonapodya prolifera (strain JEL478) TaxID=1344416 RepID=A0A139AVN2_GONPJ|nr:putative mitochondrial carrier protein [Gonapodya prolifera JEL478]|eukprot:KXS20790.1 putative mitochondrial carrier protein [Gonapodya prolifera JEL478]
MSDTWKEFAGGTVGGWAQVFVGHPFDTIKVRIQTNNQYRNALDALSDTVKNEGPKALYKGVWSPILGIGLVNAVIFSFYDSFRHLINPDFPNTPLTPTQTFQAGLATGAVTAFVNAPVEHLKIRLQTQYGSRNSAAAAAGSSLKGETTPHTLGSLTAYLVRTRGFTSLFRGLWVTIVRDTPSFAFYFWSYEMVKKALEDRAAKTNGAPRELNVIELILAGGTAGICCWLPCIPQDVVKSRFQSNDTYRSSLEAMRDVYARKGIRGFFKGVGPTLVRAFPANAATFLAYEMTMRRIAPGRHGRSEWN